MQEDSGRSGEEEFDLGYTEFGESQEQMSRRQVLIPGGKVRAKEIDHRNFQHVVGSGDKKENQALVVAHRLPWRSS